MHLIYYNFEKAKEIRDEINMNEGLPEEGLKTKTATFVRHHPYKDKYALKVSHLAHRQYINELFAQERVENLSEDWFEEEIT